MLVRRAGVDGEPVALGESGHDGSVLRGGVIEHVTVDLDPAALQRVTTAREVRYPMHEDRPAEACGRDRLRGDVSARQRAVGS